MNYKNILILLVLTISFSKCKKISKDKQPIALNNYIAFDWFKYSGNDISFSETSKKQNEYYNPIIPGFYPDPSICRVGNNFYLITSSFSYFPGIPIFKSTDLVNWKQIGHVIHRKEQADFNKIGVSKGMFAPTIRYNKGTFYVICTNVSSGGHFIVTSKNPEGPWSNPMWVKGVEGIDPDLFFDDNGKVYITHNGPPPNNISLHDGHRAIYTFEYDLENQKIIGESKLIVNGGTDLSKKPVWIEAPHIFKKNGFYYLICAEGGTGFNHSEVVFRSKDIFGPYEVYEENPILTQRHLNSRPYEITTTGHADFVELANGEWWAVFLGCRPYKHDLYNTGRETFLMPVEWKKGWPNVVNGTKAIPVTNTKPSLPISNDKQIQTTGNFKWVDNFNDKDLGLKWNFIRTPKEKWHQLDGNYLYIKPREKNIHQEDNFSFIGRRQQHQNFEASTKLNYTISNTNEAVGLVAFQNEKHYIFIGKRLNSEGKTEVFVERKSSKENNSKPQIINTKIITKSEELFVKIEGKKRYYNFYYKTTENENWKILAKKVDGTNLSTKVAQGFVGTYLAMYGSLNHFN